MTVEIAGGPPRATATVSIGGSVRNRLRLDACGVGSARIPADSASEAVEIAVRDQVLLIGSLPDVPSTGSRA